MEDVRIHRGWLERSEVLPHICLRTGQPSGGMVRKRKIVTAPAWTAILVVLGALPYILARTAVGENITFYVPESPENRKQRRLMVAAAFALAIVGTVVMVGGMFAESNPTFLLGLAVIISAVPLSIWNVRAHSIGVRMKHQDPTVRLKRVHPSAAATLQSR